MESNIADNETPSIETLKNLIENEVLKALALAEDSRMRILVDLLCGKAFYRFSEIGVCFDQYTNQHGFNHAADLILPEFITGYRTQGTDHIPKTGPLLIASNHPGAYDALIIAASVDRPDIKIIADGIPFLIHLPHVSQHILYAPQGDPPARANALRGGLRHLQAGGALLLYPSAGIDPDPAVMPGSEPVLEKWSRSLEIFLRRVPDAQVMVTIISGVLAGRWVNHPLTRLRKARKDRQRLAEMMQVITQLIRHQVLPLTPHVSYAKPYTFDINHDQDKREKVIETARQELEAHMIWLNHDPM